MIGYPLRFAPIFRQYIWGGRRLATSLGKALGDGDDFAESWEIVDHGQDQSVVLAGPLQGATLHQLLADHGAEILGSDYAAWSTATRPGPLQERFPLLFKFLDCQRSLSVQVHPNDAQGQQLDPPDLGKTEAWVVIEAEPGSLIYAGLRPGVTPDDLRHAVERGETESVLHSFRPSPGDCVFIPAGTVHALGAGLVIAEIQQASDTTFRLFDWNRVDASGQSRPLHIEESLAVIDPAAGPVDPVEPKLLSPGLEELVQCDKFQLFRRTVSESFVLQAKDRMRILAVVQGELTLEGDPLGTPLSRGNTTLLPATCPTLTAKPGAAGATVLEIYLG